VQEVVQLVVFEAGEYICTEGEIGDRMFIIESGEVAVLKAVEDSDPIEITVLRRGDIAGEMGLFGQKTRSATLRALSECRVWTLDYDVFEGLLEQHGTVAKGLLSYVCNHLVRETSVVAKLMARDMEKGLRVAFFHAAPYRDELYRQKNR